MTLELNTIHNMDCVAGMRQLIPDNSIDLILADPPYNLDRGKKQNYSFDHTRARGEKSGRETQAVETSNQQWDTYSYDEYITFSVDWLTEAYRVLKPTGSMWVFGTYHNIGIINVILHQLKYHIINEVIWYKRNATPNLTRRTLTASHENLYWVAKTKDYLFNYDWTRTSSFPEDSFKNEGKQMRTVWDIPQNKAKEELQYGKHPTQKPLSILTRMVQVSSNPSMVMLTPFAGSGSECIAAKQLGLSYIGFETSPEFVELAQNRLAD